MLRQYALIHEQLSRWARRGQRPEISWPTWNQAMNALRLVAPPNVIETGDAIDAQFWVIDIELKGGHGGLEHWLRMQAEFEEKHLAFVNAARASLLVKSAPLRRSVGRPDGAHPIWELRRSLTSGEPRPE